MLWKHSPQLMFPHIALSINYHSHLIETKMSPPKGIADENDYLQVKHKTLTSQTQDSGILLLQC